MVLKFIGLEHRGCDCVGYTGRGSWQEFCSSTEYLKYKVVSFEHITFVFTSRLEVLMSKPIIYYKVLIFLRADGKIDFLDFFENK